MPDRRRTARFLQTTEQRSTSNGGVRAAAGEPWRAVRRGERATVAMQTRGRLPAARKPQPEGASGSCRRIAWVCSGPAVNCSTPQIERPLISRASTAGQYSGGACLDASQINAGDGADKNCRGDGGRRIVTGHARHHQHADCTGYPHRGATCRRPRAPPAPHRQPEDQRRHQDGRPGMDLGRPPCQPAGHKQEGTLRRRNRGSSLALPGAAIRCRSERHGVGRDQAGGSRRQTEDS